MENVNILYKLNTLTQLLNFDGNACRILIQRSSIQPFLNCACKLNVIFNVLYIYRTAKHISQKKTNNRRWSILKYYYSYIIYLSVTAWKIYIAFVMFLDAFLYIYGLESLLHLLLLKNNICGTFLFLSFHARIILNNKLVVNKSDNIEISGIDVNP